MSKLEYHLLKELSGIAIVKLMHKYHIGTMRVKISHNQSILQIINNKDETIHYTPSFPWELLISDPLDIIMLQKV